MTVWGHQDSVLGLQPTLALERVTVELVAAFYPSLAPTDFVVQSSFPFAFSPILLIPLYISREEK